ncbi:hypothetical protein PCI56_15300 [Plesiomonas shigelloides subsp. oncorhynchi]|nr:hypothetical protein [Plesiomonas shigelloides]
MSTLAQPKPRRQYPYKWQAVNRQGHVIEGELEASSVDEARIQLMSKGFSRIELKKYRYRCSVASKIGSNPQISPL